jgi:hypothetical protein
VSPLRRLATALRVVLAATLVVVIGALPVRLVAHAFDPFAPYPGHTADYGIERSRAIRVALPAIAEQKEDVAIVLGSSGIGRAFVPAAFDGALASSGKRVVSYNLAQFMLQPETALATARFARSTFEERHKRIGIAIVGVSVPELARDSVRAAARAMPDQAFTFATADSLLERAHTDPAAAFDDALDLALFGNVRPARLKRWTDDWWAAHPVGCNSGMKQPGDTPEQYAELVIYCKELNRQFPKGVPPWNTATRGALDFGLPETRPMLEKVIALQNASAPATLPAPDPKAKAREDVDEAAILTTIAAVRELAPVSDRIFVLREVLNPAVLATFPAAQSAYWRNVAARIAREGGATLLDLNDGTLTPAEFGDRTHLNPIAAERFSRELASRVRPMVLREDHASR